MQTKVTQNSDGRLPAIFKHIPLPNILKLEINKADSSFWTRNMFRRLL